MRTVGCCSSLPLTFFHVLGSFNKDTSVDYSQLSGFHETKEYKNRGENSYNNVLVEDRNFYQMEVTNIWCSPSYTYLKLDTDTFGRGRGNMVSPQVQSCQLAQCNGPNNRTSSNTSSHSLRQLVFSLMHKKQFWKISIQRRTHSEIQFLVNLAPHA